MSALARRAPRIAAVLGALALAFAFATAGCSSSDSYAYVNVTVTIDRQSIPQLTLLTVAGCEFEVRGVETSDPQELTCREGVTPYDVGTFRWATPATMGSLQFFVNLFNANRTVIGQGQSDPVMLSSGAHLMTTVNVTAAPTQQTTDGGPRSDDAL